MGMKKSRYIIPLVIFSLLIGFTSCFQVNPSYWGSWDEIDGYMVKDSESSTTRHFEAYSPSITDKQYPATMYTHSYSETPRATFTGQEWDQPSISYKTTKTKSISFSNSPREENGFIYYKDSNTLYVINTLYNNNSLNKPLKLHTDRTTHADYRMIIDVTGIYEDIEILMDLKSLYD